LTARSFVYGKLITASSSVGTGENARVFAKKSMTSSREQHPYIVYKLGNNTTEGLSETDDPSRQFIQVYIHDFQDEHVGDYTLIDQIIVEVKAVFKLASSAPDGVIAVRYLETSQDLNDETLNTVMKYIRFQLVMEGE